MVRRRYHPYTQRGRGQGGYWNLEAMEGAASPGLTGKEPEEDIPTTWVCSHPRTRCWCASPGLSSGESQEAWLEQSLEVSLLGRRAEGKVQGGGLDGQTEYPAQWARKI